MVRMSMSRADISPIRYVRHTLTGMLHLRVTAHTTDHPHCMICPIQCHCAYTSQISHIVRSFQFSVTVHIAARSATLQGLSRSVLLRIQHPDQPHCTVFAAQCHCMHTTARSATTPRSFQLSFTPHTTVRSATLHGLSNSVSLRTQQLDQPHCTVFPTQFHSAYNS